MKFGFVAIVAAIQIFAATAFAAPIAVANNDLAKRSPSGDVAGLSSAWKRDDDDSVEAAGLTGAPYKSWKRDGDESDDVSAAGYPGSGNSKPWKREEKASEES
ncbi:hypothetical protein FRC02_005553 [Tulasnella sp. 418]|nr:hypothetical protein FRC02_005553 [Tulasnella sp. 418]